MPSDYQRIAAERRRLELADRKAEQEKRRDPEHEAAFCAWAAYRVNGGDMTFEQWRRQGMHKEGQDGQ
ncbi:MAG: hypothetical protein EBR82_48390 [Caulobacteraceae bacterium]|nr:hypothetical protein [Caulobacteraceae bacterium]